jgi:hypothetical protein
MDNRLTYFDYLRSQLDATDALDQFSYRVHRKLAYLTTIDALAAATFPLALNHERFTQLVNNFGVWESAERVSAPYLLRALRRNPDPAYSKVRRFLQDAVSDWVPLDMITISRDPEANHVGTHWPPGGKKFESAFHDLPWTRFKHLELLYKYRNSLVHEFRTPGHDFQLEGDKEPFYISGHDLKEPTAFHEANEWHLVYPDAFLKTLSRTCLQRVEEHFSNDRLDAFRVLGSTEFWFASLAR